MLMNALARLAFVLTLACLVPTLLWPTLARGADFGPLIEKLQAVGPEGQGHREAAAAWAELVAAADADDLPALLAGLDGANPLAANWVRTAVDAVTERAIQDGRGLDGDELAAFVRDTGHGPRGRQLAFDWLREVDRQAADGLVPGLLEDPSLPLRREAVRRLIGDAIQVAKLSDETKALPLWRRAFHAARDLDQVRQAAKRLRDAGEEVDLARHFGFIRRWHVIGPFDNTGEAGFDTVYPPETEIDLTAEYEGKDGRLKWIEHTSGHEFGRVDCDKILGEQKGVLAYAVTDFLCDEEQEVEFRWASFNATKLWLNGRLIAAHDVYHAGSQFDQYISRVTLEPGKNRILVKVCQNEQTQDWTNKWYFQLRVCDEIGTAILSADRAKKDAAQ